ncbi:hypothetical protein ACFVIM_03870 [Streptomyces sp. NPDC057638]|uniref:hypothetical protein n=1 Tax=Streptomyces sp. NPDC057638 TaxID=3346190 RepID=UPI0036B18769
MSEEEPMALRRMTDSIRRRWTTARPGRARLRQEGPSKRVQAWIVVISVVSVPLAVWSLAQGADENEKDEFSVIELSAGSSRAITTKTLSASTGRQHTGTTHATVLVLRMANNTDDLKVFRKIKVTTRSFTEVTDCVTDTGGDVPITKGYGMDLPAQGKSTQKRISYQMQPRQAEGMTITLGPRTGKRGIYELEVSLHDGSGYQRAGTVLALSDPGLRDLYPLDVDALPISSFPNADCVRKLTERTKELIDATSPAPAGLRELHQGLTVTLKELGGAP